MKSCCCSEKALYFKLGLFGVVFSFALLLLGLVPPFSGVLVRFPLAWVLSLLFLVPSMAIYFNVKDEFWAEVMKEKSKGSQGNSA